MIPDKLRVMPSREGPWGVLTFAPIYFNHDQDKKIFYYQNTHAQIINNLGIKLDIIDSYMWSDAFLLGSVTPLYKALKALPPNVLLSKHSIDCTSKETCAMWNNKICNMKHLKVPLCYDGGTEAFTEILSLWKGGVYIVFVEDPTLKNQVGI
jgi:hypothetical protein